jgi:replicative DNA helicase
MSEEKLIYNLDGGRMPYSVEAEQAVLGSILIDPPSINLVASQLKPEFFYIPQHREILLKRFSVYRELYGDLRERFRAFAEM